MNDKCRCISLDIETWHAFLNISFYTDFSHLVGFIGLAINNTIFIFLKFYPPRKGQITSMYKYLTCFYEADWFGVSQAI